MSSPHPMPLADRIALTNNACGKKIMQTMLDKKSRLAVSADVTDAESLLRLTEQVAEHICILKTHIDIIHDFSPELINELLLCDLYHDTNPMAVAAVDAENKLKTQQGIQ